MFYETVFVAMLNGYWIFQVGMDKVAGSDTRLTYCTTGVLLQKLITGKNMHQYTHVILDEVNWYDTYHYGRKPYQKGFPVSFYCAH